MKFLILLAGTNRVKGVEGPAPLIPHNGKTVLEKMSDKIKAIQESVNVIGVLRDDDVKSYHLDSVFQLAFENSSTVSIYGETSGAACSALMAIDHLVPDTELLVLSGDEIVESDFNLVIESFRRSKADAGVVTFESIHPSFSFAQIENGEVFRVSEKNPISKNALAGFFYFKSSVELIEGLKLMIRKHVVVNDVFYLSHVLNEFILSGKKVHAFKIDQKNYFPLKNEIQIHHYLENV